MKYPVLRWLGNKWKVCGRKLPWRNVVHIPDFCLEELKEPRRIFEPKRDEVTGIGENYITRSLMICSPHPILFG